MERNFIALIIYKHNSFKHVIVIDDKFIHKYEWIYEYVWVWNLHRKWVKKIFLTFTSSVYMCKQSITKISKNGNYIWQFCTCFWDRISLNSQGCPQMNSDLPWRSQMRTTMPGTCTSKQIKVTIIKVTIVWVEFAKDLKFQRKMSYLFCGWTVVHSSGLHGHLGGTPSPSCFTHRIFKYSTKGNAVYLLLCRLVCLRVSWRHCEDPRYQ